MYLPRLFGRVPPLFRRGVLAIGMQAPRPKPIALPSLVGSVNDKSPLLLAEGGSIDESPIDLGAAAVHAAPERKITWWQLAALAYVTVAGVCVCAAPPAPLNGYCVSVYAD